MRSSGSSLTECSIRPRGTDRELHATVAATLSPGETFALWYYNRPDVPRRKERGANGKYYERWRTKERVREQWVAMPLPNAGARLKDVLALTNACRQALAPPVSVGGSSREILRCAVCRRDACTGGGGSYKYAVPRGTTTCASKHLSRAGCEHRMNYRARALEH